MTTRLRSRGCGLAILFVAVLSCAATSAWRDWNRADEIPLDAAIELVGERLTEDQAELLASAIRRACLRGHRALRRLGDRGHVHTADRALQAILEDLRR